MLEVLGGLIIMSMVVRVNSLMDSTLTDRIFTNLKIWLPPSKDAIEATKAPQHKRSKQPTKSRNIHERVNMLGLKQGFFSHNALARQYCYEVLNHLCISFLLALVSMIWQWCQNLAHPSERLLDVSGWVVVYSCCAALWSLICLSWKDDFKLSKWERKAFAFSLGILAGAILLALPRGVLTFDLHATLEEVAGQMVAWRQFTGLFNDMWWPDPTGPSFLLLALACALLAGVLINPAYHASYTYVYVGKLGEEHPWLYRGLMAEPFLCLFIAISFLRPMMLAPLQTNRFFLPCAAGMAASECNAMLPGKLADLLPPTDDGWLLFQSTLLASLVLLRGLLTCWQVQMYMEFGALELLIKSFANKELEVAPVELIFQRRMQSCVYMALTFVAPFAWLASLLLLTVAKVFIPTWTVALLSYLNAEATGPPPLNLNGSSVVETLARGNLSAQLSYDLTVSVLDFPLVSQRCYRELLSFLLFWTVALWCICVTLSVAYRISLLNQIRLPGIL